jgi:hypothetical protein
MSKAPRGNIDAGLTQLTTIKLLWRWTSLSIVAQLSLNLAHKALHSNPGDFVLILKMGLILSRLYAYLFGNLVKNNDYDYVCTTLSLYIVS